MLLGDFINSLAKQSDVDEKDEALTKLLSIKEIATAEIPDELSSKINSSLMTMDAALNNATVIEKIGESLHSKMMAEALNPVDEKLEKLAKEVFNLDSSFIDTMKNTQGTYARMELFAKQISEGHKTTIELLEKSKGGTDTEAKAELQGVIDKLNGELSGLKENTVPSTEHQETIDGYESIILDQHVKNMFSNYTYAMDVSKDVNIGVASSIFQNELTKLGVTIVNDNGNLVLKSKLENGGFTKYFKDNKEITPKDLADGLLAEHKLLKVNGDVTPITTTAGASLAVPVVTGMLANGADPSAVAIANAHVDTLKTLGEAEPA